ncbi:hypothetical protein Gogos_005274 [Gossypium gossypioides]|uniref:Uncharacterized protein n=1 Tax=Gossypium gossypioides TaxID=34282 RepID=A0A7J9CIZ4_GOSGO|nr:hypothetical protein [Gossypium gossypioides]
MSQEQQQPPPSPPSASQPDPPPVPPPPFDPSRTIYGVDESLGLWFKGCLCSNMMLCQWFEAFIGTIAIMVLRRARVNYSYCGVDESWVCGVRPPLLEPKALLMVIGIIKRKALIKELAAVYHAECLAKCQELLELQKKWDEPFIDLKIPNDLRKEKIRPSKRVKKSR